MPDYSAEMCRVCLQDYREDFESIFIDVETLSGLGQLYEELFHLAINYEPIHPQYVCNYCNLQLKLFHKFKTKALESYMKFTQADCKDESLYNIISKEEKYETECYSEPSSVCDTKAGIQNSNIQEAIIDESSVDIVPIDHSELGDDGEDEEDEDRRDDESEFEDVQYLEETDMDDLSRVDDVVAQNAEADGNDSVKKRLRPPTGVHPCNGCDQVFGKKTDLINHRKNYHKRKQYSCNQCPKIFLSEEQLQVHLNLHWGLPAYQCELCAKSFNQKVHYTNHINNHRNKRDVQCHLCGKGFLTKSDLKIHLRMHTDERRYECEICGKKFRAHTHMKNHRYTHFGKTLECPYCQQLYTTPATLKIHIQSVHQNLCPYTCTVCNKRFKRKHHLVTHMKRHSPKNESSADFIESYT